jgi:tetratricopeptide (TPR) repeat protein
MPKSGGDALRAYASLAEQLFQAQLGEGDLPALVNRLPRLDRELLEQVATAAEQFALAAPRRGWAALAVADRAAIEQGCSPALQSLAAFYLARACNHWGQPKRVEEASLRARRGFEDLNEPDWVAACDWQLNALPWTRPDFSEAAQALARALAQLETSSLEEFVPHCRLALAYGQLLTGPRDQALQNILVCEAHFLSQGDELNQARCWLIRGNYLRRQDRFEESLDCLGQAAAIFEKQAAVVDLGKVYYHMALGHLLRADELPQAAVHFTRAIEIFRITEMDLWLGLAVNNLGSVHLLNGQLQQAESCYDEARALFLRHAIQGLLADNLNDSGKLNVLLGKAGLSIEQFRQAGQINESIGSPLQAAIAAANLGEAYGQLGRYQDALHHLERAVERLELLNSFFRLATAEKYMALVWSRLGRPAAVHEHLDRAAGYYEKAGQKALVTGVHIYRACTYFQQDEKFKGVEALRQALELANEHGMRPQAALAKRLLGEALVQHGRGEEAYRALEQARAEFEGMGMLMELAACMVSLGSYYGSAGETQKAGAAFEAALDISQGAFAEVDWRACLELGNLSVSAGELAAAVPQYRQALRAFAGIRQGFFQPALAGSYAREAAGLFDRAIPAAARGRPDQALYFVEESKASTLLLHLSGVSLPSQGEDSSELASLRAGIGLLRDQLRISLDEPAQKDSVLNLALRSRKTRAQLVEKIQQYDYLKARLERRDLAAENNDLPPHQSTPAALRKTAAQALGDNWIALDYYMAGKELVTVVVQPDHEQVFSSLLPERFQMALQACEKARRSAGPPLQSDLEILGETLLPRAIAPVLKPETHLLVSPHRRLHYVPWSALQPGFASLPLVCLCTPVVIPSLQAAALLWSRRSFTQRPPSEGGLMVAVSAFHGSHPDLPLVRQEVAGIRSRLASGVKVLSEEQATWGNLVELSRAGATLAQPAGLARFAWLHIASHFFADRYTGRLSGIALADGDIWLDQLRDLAPLPALVTLSACNSNDSFLFEGDERLDLQTTCLIAGADCVVGSAWPVLDSAAAELMLRFYDQYLSGMDPAQAVARAQREMIEQGRDLQDWGSFVCAGIP